MDLATIVARVLGAPPGVFFSGYDGSRWGRSDAAVRIGINDPRAITYLVTSPGELGMARAYVSGSLTVDGDLYTAMRTLSDSEFGSITLREKLDLLRSVGLRRLVPVKAPEQEVHLSGWRHSKARDAAAIAHHYDVSNEFYRLVLGPSMAYTCAVYQHEEATLEQAQTEKFDLVCRKLGLAPGMRLLDVGCGWGGMAMHAATHYGVSVVAATLARRQAEWGQKAVAEAGLGELVDIRHSDYRDVTETGFDAISSIGLTEHIGADDLGSYLQFLHDRMRPGGRLLNHCITRADERSPLIARKGFINRYVFPDGQLLGVARIIATMEDVGLEVRHQENLREHYAMTLRDWGANLDVGWSEAVAEVGAERARIWRAYMAGSRLEFDTNGIQLHQVLAVRTAADGSSGVPLRPLFERPGFDRR